MGDLIFNIKKGDRHKPLAAQLKYQTSSGSTAVDLSSCTVKFYMRKRGHRELKVDTGACQITNASNGYVQYEWVTADVNTAGIYEGEFVVTFSDSTEETFPESGDRIVIVIHEEM